MAYFARLTRHRDRDRDSCPPSCMRVAVPLSRITWGRGRGGREEGRKDRSEKQEERKETEKGAGGGHSTGMVDHPWMSGGVHGVTHAPRLAIDQEQAAL